MDYFRFTFLMLFCFSHAPSASSSLLQELTGDNDTLLKTTVSSPKKGASSSENKKQPLSASVSKSPLANPILDDFMNKGMLIHVGQCFLQSDMALVQTSVGVTYWSMNSMVPHDIFFQKAGRAATVVMTPLKKRATDLISVCAQEVMHAGSCRLGVGDSVLIHKKAIAESVSLQDCTSGFKCDTTDNCRCLQYTQTHFKMADGSVDIVLSTQNSSSTQHKGRRDFYLRSEIDFLKDQGVEVIEISGGSPESSGHDRSIFTSAVSEILSKKGSWQFEFSDSFWTHKSPFKIDGHTVENQADFFKAFLQENPKTSFGYEFYSANGIGSVFRILADICNHEGKRKLPNHVWDSLYAHFREIIESHTHSPLDLPKLSKEDTTNSAHEKSDIGTTATDQEQRDTLLDLLIALSPEIFDQTIIALDGIDVIKQNKDILKLAYTLVQSYRGGTGEFPLKDRKHIFESFSYDGLRSIYNQATGYNYQDDKDYADFIETRAQSMKSILSNKSIEEEQKFYTELAAEYKKLDLEKLYQWFLTDTQLSASQE